jgi:hypothetical protein
MLDARGRCDSNRPRSGTWLKTIMAFSVGLLGALAVSVQADATGYCPTARGVNPTKGTISALLSGAAVRHDLPSYVVKAVAYQESGWQQFSPNGELICNPDSGVADGLPGGIGIMQITGSTATAYDINRLATDIAYNIDVGATVLAAKWTSWSKNSDGFADDPREIIENWLYTLRGYNGAWGYAFQVAALVRNPPAALSGLAPAFPFSLATDTGRSGSSGESMGRSWGGHSYSGRQRSYTQLANRRSIGCVGDGCWGVEYEGGCVDFVCGVGGDSEWDGCGFGVLASW